MPGSRHARLLMAVSHVYGATKTDVRSVAPEKNWTSPPSAVSSASRRCYRDMGGLCMVVCRASRLPAISYYVGHEFHRSGKEVRQQQWSLAQERLHFLCTKNSIL